MDTINASTTSITGGGESTGVGADERQQQRVGGGLTAGNNGGNASNQQPGGGDNLMMGVDAGGSPIGTPMPVRSGMEQQQQQQPGDGMSAGYNNPSSTVPTEGDHYAQAGGLINAAGVPADESASQEMSSELVIGTLKVKVGLRKRALGAPWPRWGVQLLDVDGAVIMIETFDLTQPMVPTPLDNKSVMLTRPEPEHMKPFDMGQCACPDCLSGITQHTHDHMKVEGLDGHGGPGDAKRLRLSDGSAGGGPVDDNEAAVSDYFREAATNPTDIAMRQAGMRVRQMQPGPVMVKPGDYVDPVTGVHHPPMHPYGVQAGFDLDDQFMQPARMGPPRYNLATRVMMRPDSMESGNRDQPQKSFVRYYTEEEKEELRNVDWPKKIKTNGLPALWCHSCYLDKRMFKIVSPLSPKPSIVYFRHQQCNTSFHKGENLPQSIVKQYQDYYRTRGNAVAQSRAAENAGNRNQSYN